MEQSKGKLVFKEIVKTRIWRAFAQATIAQKMRHVNAEGPVDADGRAVTHRLAGRRVKSSN